jgi:trimeric autotransporter adhesin
MAISLRACSVVSGIRHVFSQLVWAFSVSIALAACSGGGGSASAPSVPPPSAPPPPAGGDTNLATLGLSIGALDQQFQPSQTSYTAKVGYLDNAVRVQVQPSDPAAVVRVNGAAVGTGTSERIALAEGQNAIDIVVENGSAQKSYSVALTREARTTFSESAYVKASNTGFDDTFGTALQLSGDTLVIGAPTEDSNARGVNLDGSNDASSDSGAAYVLVRDSSGVWSQQAYLKGSNAEPGDKFGSSVAISGNLIAVGAPANTLPGVGGAVYIFVRDADGEWTQEAYLKSSNTAAAAGDRFGTRVALENDTLVVGSPDLSTLVGSAYVFIRDANGSWSQQAVITPSDPLPDTGFSQVLALHADTLAVGAPFHPGLDLSGAVYIYRRQGANWSEEARLKGSNTGSNDFFGFSIALSGDTLAVGAYGEASGSVGIGGDQNDNTAPNSGAVYVFDRNDTGSWAQTAYIKASNAETGDTFGYSVALSNDWLAVSADNEDGGSAGMGGTESDNTKLSAGAAYLFVRDLSGNWSQQLYIKASNPDLNDRFGRSSAALSNSTLVFAAPVEDSNATGVDGDSSNNTAQGSGAVYIFE